MTYTQIYKGLIITNALYCSYQLCIVPEILAFDANTSRSIHI